MTVIVEGLSEKEYTVFTKGSPEDIESLCLRETSKNSYGVYLIVCPLVPSNYHTILSKYASSGLRVLACASRSLSADFDLDIPRDHIEYSMNFLGFIIFENRIKPTTLSILSELGAADIKISMVTGDNLLTAISVGQACGMLCNDQPVFVPIAYGNDFIRISSINTEKNEEIHYNLWNIDDMRHSLACVGDTLDQINAICCENLFREFLLRCTIFARMSPGQKKRLVENYQRFGQCICFCGDGANDCSALMAADVGISLSEANASVAAPFTSNICDISCVVKLFKISRSSMVTSFCCFKFMSLYSIIQFTTLSFLYTFGSSLSDWQFIYMDLLLILPLGIFITHYGPSQALVKKRPSTKLISAPVLTSIFSQMILQALFQGAVFFRTRQIAPPTSLQNGPNVENVEATSLALFSAYIYPILALNFSTGKPHRQSRSCICRNFLFLFLFFRFTAYLLYLCSCF
jgi:cation-transporting ATPase 13A3/4/5